MVTKGSVAEDKNNNDTFLIHRIQGFLVDYLQQIGLEGLELVQVYLGRAGGRDLKIVHVYTESSSGSQQEVRQNMSKIKFLCYCQNSWIRYVYTVYNFGAGCNCVD